jgi:hypothetical protein
MDMGAHTTRARHARSSMGTRTWYACLLHAARSLPYRFRLLRSKRSTAISIWKRPTAHARSLHVDSAGLFSHTRSSSLTDSVCVYIYIYIYIHTYSPLAYVMAVRWSAIMWSDCDRLAGRSPIASAGCICQQGNLPIFYRRKAIHNSELLLGYTCRQQCSSKWQWKAIQSSPILFSLIQSSSKYLLTPKS